MSVRISKDTVIYDDMIFKTGYGYPRGSINGMIRYNSNIGDFEFGVNEEWVQLSEIERHPMDGMIRYNEEIDEFEFLIEGEWVLRCDCPHLTPEPPPPPPPISTWPPRERPDPTEFHLIVRIEPFPVRADARWNVTGYMGLHKHLDDILLPTGHYLLHFSDVPGWTTPDIIGTTIHAGMPNDTRLITATYLPRTFKLRVIIEPEYPEMIRELATWEVQGIPGTHVHYELKDNVPMGTHNLLLSDINGWVNPGPVEFELDDTILGDYKEITVTYIEKEYTLIVRFLPEEIRSNDDTFWTVDGQFGFYYHDDSMVLPKGTYTVNFSDVTGYSTPDSVEVTLEDPLTDDTLILYITYIPDLYYIRGIISPSAVLDHAEWYIDDNTERHVHNELAPVYAGTYMVHFTYVPGWITPDSQEVTLGPGMLNDTRNVFGEYIAEELSLRVRIHPEEVRDQALWNAYGVVGLYSHNDSAHDIEPGTHVVSFSDVDGWVTPSDIIDVAYVGMPGNELVLDAYYEMADKELQVIFEPDGVIGMARWDMLGFHTNMEHEDIVEVGMGTYILEFNDIPGWGTPSPITVTVDSDSPDLNIVVVEYIEHPEADLYCGSLSFEGGAELENQTFYIGSDITWIEVVLDMGMRPDRMCIYEGIHDDLTGGMIDAYLDPWETHLLYDSGWRSTAPDGWRINSSGHVQRWYTEGHDPSLEYHGLSAQPSDGRYCINTTDWTDEVKTVVVYGRDVPYVIDGVLHDGPLSKTRWWFVAIHCYTGTPECPDDDPLPYERPPEP